MAERIEIKVVLKSSRTALFKGFIYGMDYLKTSNGIRLEIGTQFPLPVTITPPNIEDPVERIEYSIYTDIKNYHAVIVPDCGRGYLDQMRLQNLWRFETQSDAGNVKMPIYILTGQDHYMSLAFGIIGENYESSFKGLEPRTNRALIAYMRRLSFQITRGTEADPIPEFVSKQNADGSVRDYLYLRTSREVKNQPWVLTLRDFAYYQKKFFHLPDFTTRESMYPLWCSWTDWFSDDVTEEVILKNVKEGVKLGIKNYIIDDGWFGPGLDNDFDVKLNIGDWQPDPNKFMDMRKFVADIKEAGATPMIWCAPHAVSPDAKCFAERGKYLIMSSEDKLLLTTNKFYSLCFRCPESREIMADICAGLIKKWDFDGVKYDLFNCVPNVKCMNPEHTHDVSSMIQGLTLTLELIDKKCRKLKKNYIVELKQNYATPFLAQYGTMTRAGDTPYNSEGNFLRTLYNQAYTPYALNDYQTITSEDSPQETAVIVIKMMAVGIPAYSINFDRLTQENKNVLARYNKWYNENIDVFMNHRIALDPGHNIFKIPAPSHDIFFIVNEGRVVGIDRSAFILNGTLRSEFFLKTSKRKEVTLISTDCFGTVTDRSTSVFDRWGYFTIPPGGMVEISCK